MSIKPLCAYLYTNHLPPNHHHHVTHRKYENHILHLFLLKLDWNAIISIETHIIVVIFECGSVWVSSISLCWCLGDIAHLPNPVNIFILKKLIESLQFGTYIHEYQLESSFHHFQKMSFLARSIQAKLKVVNSFHPMITSSSNQLGHQLNIILDHLECIINTLSTLFILCIFCSRGRLHNWTPTIFIAKIQFGTFPIYFFSIIHWYSYDSWSFLQIFCSHISTFTMWPTKKCQTFSFEIFDLSQRETYYFIK